MRKLLSIITACFMMVTLLAGCGSEKAELGESDEMRPVSGMTMGEEEAQQLSEKVPIRLYFANEDNTKLKMEIRYIPMSEASKSVNSLATLIVKELINGPSEKSGLKATLPKETELRSPVSIEARVATVDFTKAFVDNHSGGKEAEQMTIYSIVNSLTEIKDIEQVKFKIDGSTRDNFKGSFKFDAPFSRTMSIVSKEVPKTGEASVMESDGASLDTSEDSILPVDESISGSDAVETFDNYEIDTGEVIEILE